MECFFLDVACLLHSSSELHRTVREEGRIHEAPSFPEAADVVDVYLKREEMFSSVV